MASGESALNRQVGGNHYMDFEIQPSEYISKNKMRFLPGCIVKRISRYNKPSGKGLEDLLKIIHEVELIIELEGWEDGAGEELHNRG